MSCPASARRCVGLRMGCAKIRPFMVGIPAEIHIYNPHNIYIYIDVDRCSGYPTIRLSSSLSIFGQTQVVFPNVLLRDSDVELFEDNPLELGT
jgi:hypothetical protein